MRALNGDPPVMSPESYGWLRNDATQTLSSITVPRGVEPTSEDVLKLSECQCESESPCSSLHCDCIKMIICKAQGVPQ